MATAMSDVGIATRDYIESSEFLVGSRTDTHKEIGYYPTNNIPNLESMVGVPETFVRFILSGLEYALGSQPVFYYEVSVENEVVSAARKFILTNANEGLVAQINPFLDAFEAMGEPLISKDLPPIGVSIPEEDTILIEWVLPRIRIGLFFESVHEESTWYMLSRNTDKELNAWGYLSTTGTEELAALILDQVSKFA